MNQDFEATVAEQPAQGAGSRRARSSRRLGLGSLPRPSPLVGAALLAGAAALATVLAWPLRAAVPAWLPPVLLLALAWPLSQLVARAIQEAGFLAWRDDQTPLHNLKGLVGRGEKMVARDKGRHPQATLALVDFADLAEVRKIYGEAVHQAVVAKVVAKLQRLAGRDGLAARTAPGQFAVLLPGMDRQEAIDAAHKVLGRPCRIEFDDEIVLVPDLVVDVCDVEAGCVAYLYGTLDRTLSRHRHHEERRKLHLRRERERHSRPQPLGVPAPEIILRHAVATGQVR